MHHLSQLAAARHWGGREVHAAARPKMLKCIQTTNTKVSFDLLHHQHRCYVTRSRAVPVDLPERRTTRLPAVEGFGGARAPLNTLCCCAFPCLQVIMLPYGRTGVELSEHSSFAMTARTGIRAPKERQDCMPSHDVYIMNYILSCDMPGERMGRQGGCFVHRFIC